MLEAKSHNIFTKNSSSLSGDSEAKAQFSLRPS